MEKEYLSRRTVLRGALLMQPVGQEGLSRQSSERAKAEA
jgi:hypothetical protein